MLCRAQGQDKVNTAALKGTTVRFHSHQHNFNLGLTQTVRVVGSTKKCFMQNKQVHFGSEI